MQQEIGVRSFARNYLLEPKFNDRNIRQQMFSCEAVTFICQLSLKCVILLEFKAHASVNTKITAILEVTPCSLVYRY
jgi:hypothetical protein